MMVAILVLGFAALAFIIWRNEQNATAVNQTLSANSTVTPGTQSPTISTVITKIPVVGPILAPVENAAGRAITGNQTLAAHSQVVAGTGGSQAGKTLSSSGVLGFTVKKGGWTYAQAYSGVKKVVEFWKW